MSKWLTCWPLVSFEILPLIHKHPLGIPTHVFGSLAQNSESANLSSAPNRTTAIMNSSKWCSRMFSMKLIWFHVRKPLFVHNITFRLSTRQHYIVGVYKHKRFITNLFRNKIDNFFAWKLLSFDQKQILVFNLVNSNILP